MGAVGRLIRKEARLVFTHRGMIGYGVGDMAQAACVPMRYIVKEVAHGSGAAGLEYFLLSAYWRDDSSV